MYYKRLIDKYLAEWAEKETRKPLLLRGARHVGKSTAVRHLGEKFANYVEINFERQPNYKPLFTIDLDVKRIVSQMQALCGILPCKPRKNLFMQTLRVVMYAMSEMRLKC